EEVAQLSLFDQAAKGKVETSLDLIVRKELLHAQVHPDLAAEVGEPALFRKIVRARPTAERLQINDARRDFSDFRKNDGDHTPTPLATRPAQTGALYHGPKGGAKPG